MKIYDFLSRKTPIAPTAAVAKTTKFGAIRVSCPFVGQLIGWPQEKYLNRMIPLNGTPDIKIIL